MIDEIELAAQTEAVTKETQAQAGVLDPGLERQLLISEITNKVLVLIEAGKPRPTRTRFASFRRGLGNAFRLLLTPIDPEPRIYEIEKKYMGAPFGSPEYGAYWWGLSGESMQAEIRGLYRRRMRRRAFKAFREALFGAKRRY